MRRSSPILTVLCLLTIAGCAAKKHVVLTDANVYQEAQNGNPEAQYDLAANYAAGTAGLPKDMAAALKWYQASAAQGYGLAQLDLGMLYFGSGSAVAHDAQKAAALFSKAADQGHGKSQVNLGLMMVNGTGGPKDVVTGAAWMAMAVQQNAPGAQQALAGVSLAPAEAQQVVKKAAELQKLLTGVGGSSSR